MGSGRPQADSGQAQYVDEISFLELASVILRRRRLILASTLVGAMLALAAALTTTLTYTSTLSFLPTGGEQGALSGVSGLAQQFGLSIPRSGEVERSPQFYQDLIRSREILGGLVESGVEMVTPAGVTPVDLAEYFEIEGATADETIALTRRHLSEGVVSVDVALETGVVTVNVQTDSPELCAAIGRRILELITAFDVETRQSRASAERGFAEERLRQLRLELSTAEDSLQAFLVENRQFLNSPQLSFVNDRLGRRVAIRQDLVTAMAQAYEQARIDEVRSIPRITVIDQPERPALPDPRGRLLKLLLGVTLGVMAGFALALVGELGGRTTDERSPALSEFHEVLDEVRQDPLGLRRPHRPPLANTSGGGPT